MCKETTTSYRSCLLTTVHTLVCIAYIAHTLKQEDNAPCPKLKREVINSISVRCYCRDGGECRRRGTGSEGNVNYTWAFLRQGCDDKKFESMAQREERRLKTIHHQMQVKKNELSWLRETEAWAQDKSKRKKKNDISGEKNGRLASEPDYGRSATVETDSDEDMGHDSTTSVTLYNPASAEKTRKVRELEREIEELYQDWLVRGGKEEFRKVSHSTNNSGTQKKTKKEKVSAYRPTYGDDYNPKEDNRYNRKDDHRYNSGKTRDKAKPRYSGTYKDKDGSPLPSEANSRKKRLNRPKKGPHGLEGIEGVFGLTPNDLGLTYGKLWSGNSADNDKGVWEDVKDEDDVEMQ